MTDQPDAPGVAVVARRTGEAIIHAFQTTPSQLAKDLEQAKTQGMKLKGFDRYCRGCAQLVFAFWSAKTGHPGALLDPKRQTRLEARLRESGGNVDECLYVVNGLLKDRYLMGENHRATRYDGIETIFRDRAMVERLAELGGYKEGKHHPMARKYIFDQHLNGNGNGNGHATSGAHGRGDRADPDVAAGGCD